MRVGQNDTYVHLIKSIQFSHVLFWLHSQTALNACLVSSLSHDPAAMVWVTSKPVVVFVVVDLGFMTLLTSQVISVAFCSEHENSDKFYSEALISAWSQFTCRKSTTRDPRLYCPSEGSHTQNFYALKKPRDPSRVWTREPRIQWRVWQPWDHRNRRSSSCYVNLPPIMSDFTDFLWGKIVPCPLVGASITMVSNLVGVIKGSGLPNTIN